MSDTPPANDLIWIEDAVREFQRSRDWLERQVTAKRIHKYEIPGDKRVYLSRTELGDLLKPRRIG